MLSCATPPNTKTLAGLSAELSADAQFVVNVQGRYRDRQTSEINKIVHAYFPAKNGIDTVNFGISLTGQPLEADYIGSLGPGQPSWEKGSETGYSYQVRISITLAESQGYFDAVTVERTPPWRLESDWTLDRAEQIAWDKVLGQVCNHVRKLRPPRVTVALIASGDPQMVQACTVGLPDPGSRSEVGMWILEDNQPFAVQKQAVPLLASHDAQQMAVDTIKVRWLNSHSVDRQVTAHGVTLAQLGDEHLSEEYLAAIFEQAVQSSQSIDARVRQMAAKVLNEAHNRSMAFPKLNNTILQRQEILLADVSPLVRAVVIESVGQSMSESELLKFLTNEESESVRVIARQIYRKKKTVREHQEQFDRWQQ